MQIIPPDPEQLDLVENQLYRRMVRNAFIGFVKSAGVGVLIGLLAGALGAAFFPGLPILGAGAIKAAAWLGSVAGGFGAVAGIQSTRDTRRFFLMHEARNLSPEETTERGLVLSPQHNVAVPEAVGGCHAGKILSEKSAVSGKLRS